MNPPITSLPIEWKPTVEELNETAKYGPHPRLPEKSTGWTIESKIQELSRAYESEVERIRKDGELTAEGQKSRIARRTKELFKSLVEIKAKDFKHIKAALENASGEVKTFMHNGVREMDISSIAAAISSTMREQEARAAFLKIDPLERASKLIQAIEEGDRASLDAVLNQSAIAPVIPEYQIEDLKSVLSDSTKKDDVFSNAKTVSELVQAAWLQTHGPEIFERYSEASTAMDVLNDYWTSVAKSMVGNMDDGEGGSVPDIFDDSEVSEESISAG